MAANTNHTTLLKNQSVTQPSNLRRLLVATVGKLSAAVSGERESFLCVFVFKTSLN